MMTGEKRTANAMGGKTARACDGCLLKRARWYCVADDAFLCQGCDASVHSANQLASRHERVRLETASSCNNNNKLINEHTDKDTVPVWHQGFTRKARTPRHNNNKAMLVQQAKANEPLVPEIGCEDGSLQADDQVIDEQLLYQVPVFDPFEAVEPDENLIVEGYNGQDGTGDLDDLHGFLPSDLDLAEFAADVESLLGGGGRALDEDSCDVKEFGTLLDCKEEETIALNLKIKAEEVEEAVIAAATREAIDCNFDYQSPVTGDDTAGLMSTECKPKLMRNVCLKLNYDAVITAWASQGCPWTAGSRPEINLNHCWPHCTVTFHKTYRTIEAEFYQTLLINNHSLCAIHFLGFVLQRCSSSHLRRRSSAQRVPLGSRRRKGSQSIEVQREAKNEAVFEEDKVRSEETEC